MDNKTSVVEKPMLFSAPMVRAILEGRKTQTRRIVKQQPPLNFSIPALAYGGFAKIPKCPHPVGSRIWVRETWRRDVNSGTPTSTKSPVKYKATNDWYDGFGESWRPSIHMPLWASRITLEVTDVRVQRLQEIGDADAYAEGITDDEALAEWYDGPQPIMAFIKLWNSIYGPDAWERNPWVWAYTFRRLEAARD